MEAGGFGVDAVVGDLTAKAELRGLVDTTGRPLFRSDMQGATTYALDGAPMYFPENGGFDASKAQLIAGNFKKLVYSIRQDVTVKLLDQGVIQDPSTKEIVYNLAQQDTEFSFERKLQLVQELRDMLTLAGKTVKMSIC